MSAVQLTGFGGPEKLVYRTDVPIPTPKDDEVLVKIGAASINNTDIWTREGAYNTSNDSSEALGWQGEPLQFPRIQGVDIAGTIIATGENVDRHRVGERVVIDTVLRQPSDRLFGSGIFGSERDGGFAEFVASPSQNAIRFDGDQTFIELASVPTAGLTALHMLNRGRLKSGETVVVSGASGGVGSSLVQLAKLRGARVVALVGEGKEAQVAEIGADIVVNRSAMDFSDQVKAAVNGVFDLYADVVGGDSFEALLPLIRPEGGRYVTAGAIAGPTVKLDLRILYLNHLELIGSTIGTREEFIELLEYVKDKKFQPKVYKTFSLAEISIAQATFMEKSFFGKLVLVP